MAIYKCKMCAGSLEIAENQEVCTCEYCGIEQTLPRLNSDRKVNLYDRASHFRRNNDYDKAMGIYEQILNEDGTDAEAYWSLVLCHYGIEYVEDPATHRRIPTINRAQYTSVFADENYKAAIEHASPEQKIIYEQEAKTIDEIQKGILSISQKEEPFDVFICYKESDENGRRTPDSVLANDLYHQLTQEGFKVFFARITLEDKLGQEYEPYIFAALNSAKVMVVLGTKPQYFNAVWVKNEWARYLALIRSGAKKMLIPAYKDMDPYDLPEEFSHLQAQDMTKLGFMQDLIRGIKKITGTDQPQAVAKENVVVQQGGSTGNANALIERGNMALEDGEWQKADEFFEEVLNQDAKCAEAYLGKCLLKHECSDTSALVKEYISEYEVADTERLEACPEDSARIAEAVSEYTVLGYLADAEIKKQYVFDRTYLSETSSRKQQKNQAMRELANEKLLARAQQYATGETKTLIDKMISDISAALDERISAAEKHDKESIDSIKNSYEMHLKTADAKVAEMFNIALKKQETTYKTVVLKMDSAQTISEYECLRDLFKGMNGYKDTVVLAKQCQIAIERLIEEERLTAERIENTKKLEAEQRAKKLKRTVMIISAVIVIFVATIIIVKKIVIPNYNYKKAVDYMDKGSYYQAISSFELLDGFKDSNMQIKECNYRISIANMENGDYSSAVAVFGTLSGYKESQKYIDECYYCIADICMADDDYDKALLLFMNLGNYKDSDSKYEICQSKIYEQAIICIESGQYDIAEEYLKNIPNYPKTQYGLDYILYCTACEYMESADLLSAINTFAMITDEELLDASEDNIEKCLRGLEYDEAYDECIFYVRNSSDVTSAYEKINKVLQMDSGATEDKTEALNIELQYLNMYSSYLGSYKLVGGDERSSYYFYIVLDGFNTNVFLGGYTYTFDGDKLISGNKWISLSNGNAIKQYIVEDNSNVLLNNYTKN